MIPNIYTQTIASQHNDSHDLPIQLSIQTTQPTIPSDTLIYI